MEFDLSQESEVQRAHSINCIEIRGGNTLYFYGIHFDIGYALNDYNIVRLRQYLNNTESIEQVHFSNCKLFTKNIGIVDENIWRLKFDSCIFDGSSQVEKYLLQKVSDERLVEFNDCIIEEFSFGDHTDIRYKRDIEVCNFQFRKCEIKQLKIWNIEFSSKLYIHRLDDFNSQNLKIDKLVIEGVIFKENFKLHNCEIGKVKMRQTDFEKNADFFKSEFKSGIDDDEIIFAAINFRRLALFGECMFHQKTNFKYVTFEDSSHFRGAEFLKGLNLDYANIQKEINFFKLKGLASIESKRNTTRETYRIIKNSFEKVNNNIEANKYFALEMDRHSIDLNELTYKEAGQAKLIFKFNKSISNFGQSYKRPLIYLVVLIIIYALIIYGNEEQWLREISVALSDALNCTMHILNYPFKNIQVLSKLLKEGFEFVSLLFYIMYSILIWHIIMAIKKHTKR